MQQLPSAPAYAGGSVYLNIHPPWVLLSVDARTGEERWRKPFRAFHAPLFAGGSLYALDHDAVVQLDPQSGDERHRWSSSDEVTTTPALAGAALLYGNKEGVLYAVKAPASAK